MACAAMLTCGLGMGGDALACSVCGCGDPLTAAGDAMPMAGMFRGALEGEYLTASAAAEEDPSATESVVQTTLRPLLVYSPVDRLNLVLQVPLVRKQWTLSGGAPDASDRAGLGDLDLGARWFLWQGTDFHLQRRQSFALSAGTSLPTGVNDALGASGLRIDDHAQLGAGAVGPYAGALYAFHQDPWNFSVSVSARLHAQNAFGYQYGPAMLASARGIYRPWDRAAFMLGIDGRFAGRDLAAGALQQNTGGLLLAVVPGVSVNLTSELWLHLSVQLPFFAQLFGVQRVGPVVGASLQYSFGT